MDEQIYRVKNKLNGAYADERVAAVGCGTAGVLCHQWEHSLRPAEYGFHIGSSDSYRAAKL